MPAAESIFASRVARLASGVGEALVGLGDLLRVADDEDGLGEGEGGEGESCEQDDEAAKRAMDHRRSLLPPSPRPSPPARGERGKYEAGRGENR
jgi:hypothetical protein